MKKLFKSLLIPLVAPLAILPCVTACKDNEESQISETFDITNGIEVEYQPLQTNELMSMFAAKVHLLKLHKNNPHYFRQEFLLDLYNKVHTYFSFQDGDSESRIEKFIVTINSLSIDELRMRNKQDGPYHKDYSLSFDINIHLVVSFDYASRDEVDVKNTYEIDSSIKYDHVFFDMDNERNPDANFHFAFGPKDGIKYGEAPLPVDPTLVETKTSVHKTKTYLPTEKILTDVTQTFNYHLNTFHQQIDQLDVGDEKKLLLNGNFTAFNQDVTYRDMEFFAKFLTKYDADSYYLGKRPFVDTLIPAGEGSADLSLNKDHNAIDYNMSIGNMISAEFADFTFKPTKIRIDEDNDIIIKETTPVNPAKPRHIVIDKHAEFQYNWNNWSWTNPGEFDHATHHALLLDKNGNAAGYTEQELSDTKLNWVEYAANISTICIVVEFTDQNGNKIETPSLIWGNLYQWYISLQKI